MPSMNGGSIQFWGIVRAKCAGSCLPSCLSRIDGLLASGGTDLCLQMEWREESGNVVVWKIASAANTFGRLRLSNPLGLRP